jgi:hypothetical protein
VQQASKRKITVVKIWTFNTFSMAEQLLHYPLEILQHWKILLVANLFLCWGTLFFWVVAPCGRVITSQHFKGMCVFISSVMSPWIDWRPWDKGLCSMESTGRNYPTTWRNNPEYLVSLTVMHWKPQTNVFLLLRIYFWLCCFVDWLSMKEWNYKSFHNIWTSVSMNT